MSAKWPKVQLGEVLRQRKEFFRIDDSTIYKRPRVQLHVRGIVLRDEIQGALIKTKTQQVCNVGEFLVAEIDAKVGGFGIVPSILDQAIVSSHYFLFCIDEEKLDRKFLGYFIRTPAFAEQVAAQGSTNYAAIRPSDVLNYIIPLPPLSGQQRIVARIEELAAQVSEAQRLRRKAIEEAEGLFSCALSAILSATSSQITPLGKIIGEDSLRNGKSVKPSEMGTGIRCLTLSAIRCGRIDITCTKPVPMTSIEAQPFLVNQNDVFIVRGNGSKHLCGLAGLVEEDARGVIFPDLFIRASIPPDQILPGFFVSAWNSLETRKIIEDKAKTTSGIWKVNQSHIMSTPIPVPSVKEQRRIVAYLDGLQAQVDELKRLQSETAVELDALLPSILDKAFRGEM